MEKPKVTYSPKDAKIIKDNPGKSPYELQALGLSAKGFAKLMDQQSTGAEPVADPNIKDDDETPVDPLAYQEPPAEAPEDMVEEEQDDDEEEVTQPKSEMPVQVGPAPLVPKITQIKQPQTPAAAINLLPNQVLVQAPNGKLNPMGREFAQKLVKMDPKYKIIR